MIAALVALSVAAQGQPLSIPETPWSVVDGGSWTPGELQQLSALAARLPPALVQQEGIVLARGDAPVLSDPPALEHPRRWPRPDQPVSLSLDGLRARAAAWIGAHPGAPLTADELATRLLQRQVVHALAHRLDAGAGLSADPRWERLSEWRAAGRRAVEADPLMFAEPAGAADRREDLATTVALLWVPGPVPGDVALHPACRMPSKVAFVEAYLGPSPGEPDCTALHGVALAPEQVRDVDLVLIQSSVQHPASIGGHMSVMVEVERALGGAARESFTLSAATGEGTGLRYMFRGLTGGWPSVISSSSYRKLALYYAETEDRDLRRYRLSLTPEDERALLQRLHEIRFGWRRPYVFATRNCTRLPLELAWSVLPEDAPLRLPRPFSADALLGRLHSRGLLVPVAPDRLEEHSLSARAQAGGALRGRVRTQLEAGPDAAILHAPLRAIGRRSASDRAEGYQAIATHSAHLDPQTLRQLDPYLAWSDPIERLALREARARRVPAHHATIDALRAAKAHVRHEARRAGLALAQEPDSGALLLAAIEPPITEGSDHTPLRQLSVLSSVRAEPDQAMTPWLVLRRSLYASEVGEARRFSLAPGLAIALLQGQLQLQLDATPELRTSGLLLSVRRIRGARRLGNLGTYAELLALESHWAEVRALQVGWIGAGRVLELWRSQRQRAWLQGSLGLSLVSRWPDLARLGPDGTGLGLPARLQLHLGSPRQALTALDLVGSWSPVIALGGGWHQPSALARGRLALGEPLGAALAVEAAYEGRALGSWRAPEVAWSHQGQLGLVLEAF